jgi:hypothetical protein
MNLEQLRLAKPTGNPRIRRHQHFAGPVTRRQVLGASFGLALGGAFGSSLLLSAKPASGAAPPTPVPGGTAFLGGGFHVFAPGFDPIDAEPITITDFDGVVGLAYVSGTCTRTNLSTGEVTPLWFTDNDMRFMQGKYRAANGTVHDGTFAFI